MSGDGDLLEEFLTPVRLCAEYKPKFGRSSGEGVSLPEFQQMYGSDAFYAWLGLDEPVVYAAHKAAGGLTSVYRQVGIGTERLVRAVLHREFALSPEQMDWSYQYQKDNGEPAVRTLDARVSTEDLSEDAAARVEDWFRRALAAVSPGDAQPAPVEGLVMEVRQGYKSADSKRQAADLRFGMRAYQADLLPVVMVMSSQVSQPVIKRYRADGMVVLTGILSDDPLVSSFAFFEEVIGFDLAGFLDRNSRMLRTELAAVVQRLLQPDAP